MKYYFKLQAKRIKRAFSESEIPFIPGLLLLLLGFWLLSEYLFSKIAYAELVYLLLGVMTIDHLWEPQKNQLLEQLFDRKHQYLIRGIEQIGIAFPFCVFLIYQGSFLSSSLLLLLAGLMVLRPTAPRSSRSFPTPFARMPFEFIVGFRRTWPFLLLTYFLTYKAIAVSNFNLGVFSSGIVFLICMSYYGQPEKDFFVWIFSKGPRAFLWKKILIAIGGSLILTFPIIVALGISFPERTGILLGSQSLGYLVLTLMVLMKYAAYPDKIGVPQAILFALCLWLPPLILVIGPMFFLRAKDRLSFYLE